MTLKRVVLPAPLGPMMPTISPGAARRETSRTAVSPPKRLVTASSSSIAAPGAEALAEPADQSLGDEAHDDDEEAAVDDEIDAHQPAPHVAEGGAEARLERRDEDRSHEGAHGRPDAADDGVEGEADREIDGKDVEGIHEAHVLRPQGAAGAGQRGGDGDGQHLEPAARDAEGLGGVLVLAHAGEPIAEPRALEVDLHAKDAEGEGEHDVHPGYLAREAERPQSRPERHGHALGAGGERAPAARHDEEDLREGDGGEAEVRSLEAIRQVADDEPGQGGDRGPDDHGDPRRAVQSRGDDRGGVGADAEEGGVAERGLPRVAACHVPGSRHRAPEQDEDEAVEEEAIPDDEGREGGADEDDDGEHVARHGRRQTPRASAPRWPKRPAGRKTSTAMKSTK